MTIEKKRVSRKNNRKTTRKTRGPTSAELKRQLAAAKLESTNLKADIAKNAELAQTNPNLTNVNPDLVGEGLEDITDKFTQGMDAQHVPAVLRKSFETEEQTVGQDHIREMNSTGPANESLQPAVIQPVGKVYSKEKMEMLQFMEDVLTVRVHETTNEIDVPIPVVYNDGRSQYFIRGSEQEVKRKFIEILARCKKTAFTQELYEDGDGNKGYRYIPHTANVYPFSVLRDPDPRGSDWLRNILSEG